MHVSVWRSCHTIFKVAAFCNSTGNPHWFCFFKSHRYLWSYFSYNIIVILTVVCRSFLMDFIRVSQWLLMLTFFLGLFVKCLFPSFAHLLIGLWGWVLNVPFFIETSSSLSYVWYSKYFLMSSLVLFFLLIVFHRGFWFVSNLRTRLNSKKIFSLMFSP